MANYSLDLEAIKKDLNKKSENLKKEIALISSLNINTKKDGSDFQNLKKALENNSQTLHKWGTLTDEEIEEHNKGMRENEKRGYYSAVYGDSLDIVEVRDLHTDKTGNNQPTILFNSQFAYCVSVSLNGCESVQDVRKRLISEIERREEKIKGLQTDLKDIEKIYNKYLKLFEELDKVEKINDYETRNKFASEFRLLTYAHCFMN